jgi:hypothetical protein
MYSKLSEFLKQTCTNINLYTSPRVARSTPLCPNFQKSPLHSHFRYAIRVLLENLKVVHLIKKLSALCNPKGYCRFHKISPLDPILSQLSPVHILTYFFCKIRFNIILSVRLKMGVQWDYTSAIYRFQ